MFGLSARLAEEVAQGCLSSVWVSAGGNPGLQDGCQPAPEMGAAPGIHGVVPIRRAPCQHKGMDRRGKKKWGGTEKGELAEDYVVEPGTIPLIMGISAFLPVFPPLDSGCCRFISKQRQVMGKAQQSAEVMLPAAMLWLARGTLKEKGEATAIARAP